MASEESIRTDASTVHRPLDASTSQSDAQSVSTEFTDHPADAEQIAEAKTVIRGSSQIDGNLRTLGNSPAAVAKVLQGKHLDHFLLEEMIGGGGMGAVFRAHDEQLDRVVAIKVIPFVGEDVDLRRRFHNEAKSAAKLDHPRIASIYAVGHRGDWHYIVFEYIRGTNIRDLVNTAGVLSVDDAVYYTCELAAALQHAADRGIVHRDIKPSNVLIGNDNNIKLVDMGLARSDNLELSEDKTASGVTLGTFDYISPEQARDPRIADLRSDLYSLGCTLYFMLTGSPPYPGGTMLQKLLSHGNSPPPNPQQSRPEVSDYLAAVIQKMLAKDPTDRYQNANDLISDLQAVSFQDGLIRAQGTRSVVVQQPSAIATWLERHAPWIIASFLLLLSVVWLQLMSASSREEFSLTPSESAKTPTRYTPAQNAPNNRPLDPPGQPAGNIQSESPPASETSVVVPDSAPPTMRVPIPDELNAEPIIDSEQQPAEANVDTDIQDPVDSSLGIPPGVEFPIEDPVIDPFLEPEIAPNRIRVLGQSEGMDLLADPLERFNDGVLLSASLSEAVQLAAKYQTQRIEIAAPVIHSAPITIDSDGLWIYSTIPGGSVVKFEAKEMGAMERARMISLGPNRIEMDDLHFSWDVPSGLIEGGALLGTNDNRQIRMTDCSITISNLDPFREVYAIEVVTDPEAMDLSAGERARPDEALPLVAIELNNVIVRGQMTMLHMDFATELQLQWDNGLLAISERMIDTAGARIQPPLNSGPNIKLSLSDLTARIPKGLLRMRLGPSGQHMLVIDREARDCVFVVDSNRPYVEVIGMKSLTDQAPLKLRGEANVYVADQGSFEPMLKRTDRANQSLTTQLSQMTASNPGWFTEASHGRSLRWSAGGLPEIAPHRVEPSHYWQDGTVVSGFDRRFLAQLPDILTLRQHQADTATAERYSGDSPENREDF